MTFYFYAVVVFLIVTFLASALKILRELEESSDEEVRQRARFTLDELGER